MDAKILGAFIAGRRKELSLTQAQLAEKIHVTDKAVSRWERGVGLPDINLVEDLAKALDVSLVELMQAKKEERESITTGEAEKIVYDTIYMKVAEKKKAGFWGRVILGCFIVISVFLLSLLFTDGNIVMYSVASLVTGFVAWGIPIWRMTYHKKGNSGPAILVSMGFAFSSVAIQIMDIKSEAFSGDYVAILDTIQPLISVVILFSAITIGLNYQMLKKEC